LDGERVGVVSSNKTDSINGEEGTENGSTLNDNVVIEEIRQASHDESTGDVETPIGSGGSSDKLVHYSVVKNKAKSEATPAGEYESTKLSIFLEDKSKQESHQN
jgi:hypothetical protein